MSYLPRQNGEQGVLQFIEALLDSPPADETWIGDDAAVVGGDSGPILLTADLTVAGVHADLELVSLEDMGWKALASSVSDIAAMGGRALWALVSVAAPPGTQIKQLYAGIAAACEAHECPVVGGDLSNSKTLVISVAVVGTGDGTPPVLRSGAKPGHWLLVTGPLGAAAAGLAQLRATRSKTLPERDPGSSGVADPTWAHRRPVAKLAEGRSARRAGAAAMIDISDGLAIDLDHLARSSGVGISLDRVPVSPGATLLDALGGGEDYELIIAAPSAAEILREFEACGLRTPLVIGKCTAQAEDRLLDGEPFPIYGYQHDFS
ncbi:MAG: thiamine-phosphate kinase [Actinobacteria bacterium]|nr:thiamine-phosphate kinase [Actinomycetota bacterium]